MITIISPAKTFRKTPLENLNVSTELYFPEQTKQLLNILMQYSQEELAALMKLSTELASVNYTRFQNFDEQQSLSAIFAFEGEAYKGLDAKTLKEIDILEVNDRVVILCGLFGMLHPTTEIKPYRLEMAQKFKDKEISSLYEFWKPILTAHMFSLLEQTSGDKALINLASNEYSKSLNLKEIEKKYPVISIEFKDKKDENFRVVAMYAKKARGQMLRYIIENKINTLTHVKTISIDGYVYNDRLSTKNQWIFTR